MNLQVKFIQAILVFIAFPVFTEAQTYAGNIKINQLGYYPNAPKIAVVTEPVSDNDFSILKWDSKDTVYRGRLSDAVQSRWSSAQTRIADFSSFNKNGRYVLFINSTGSSYPFEINDNIFHSISIAVLKGFYFQRMSTDMDEKYAGAWKRKGGHPDTTVFIHPSAATIQRPAGTKISVPGGWYDAGDYNKYIVNSGITMGTLLSAYEDLPVYFNKLKTNIPESNNGAPDILNEIVYNLRWMLSMQDPFDGGVYNKCTNAAFDKMIMPDAAGLPRYVVQKGTAAALDFAAVTAQAGRILKKFTTQFPGLSDSCIHAAETAWQWAEKNPAREYDQDRMNAVYEPKITTGGYGDKNYSDEWFWAASELFISAKNKKYENILLQTVNDSLSLPSWSNVRLPGYYSLLRCQSLIIKTKIDFKSLKNRLLRFADSFISDGGNKAFRTVMGQSRKDFIWGSNSVAANQGIVLMNAFLLTRNKKYVDYALSNLDYLLGRNATGYCFVTGFGYKSTMHPHHRLSIADGITEPVPGLLAGGPNPGMQDHCHYDFSEPETAYSDTDCSYASNEIAINWNAPLVYLVNAIEALQKEVGYSKK